MGWGMDPVLIPLERFLRPVSQELDQYEPWD